MDATKIIVCKPGSLFFDSIHPLFQGGGVDALYFAESDLENKPNGQALAFLLAPMTDLSPEALEGLQTLREAVQFVFDSDDLFSLIMRESMVRAVMDCTSPEGIVNQDEMANATLNHIVNKYLQVAYMAVVSILEQFAKENANG